MKYDELKNIRYILKIKQNKRNHSCEKPNPENKIFYSILSDKIWEDAGKHSIFTSDNNVVIWKTLIKLISPS